MRIVVDSSALLAYLGGEKGDVQMESILRKAAKGKSVVLCMSTVQYGEVLYTAERWLGNVYREEVAQMFSAFPIELVPVDTDQAHLAAFFKAKGGISYPDCFALALAKLQGGTVLTKDKEFEKFKKTVRIKWLTD